MRWLLILAVFSLFAQDEDLVARHAAAAAADMQAGNYASAERHDRAIVRLRPKLAEAEANLGLSCFLQKKYEQAVQAFSTGLKLNPELDNAKLFLGISKFKLGDPSAALPVLQEYVSRHAGDFQGQYYIGLSYLELNRFRDAERPLITARDIDTRNIDVLYHLAQSYLGQARNNPSKRDLLEQSYRAAVERIKRMLRQFKNWNLCFSTIRRRVVCTIPLAVSIPSNGSTTKRSINSKRRCRFRTHTGARICSLRTSTWSWANPLKRCRCWTKRFRPTLQAKA
jgi:tetratricopeptide (TPR) repeat protein